MKSAYCNTGGYQKDVSGQMSHLENVDDVVGHHVGSAKLLPGLDGHSG